MKSLHTYFLFLIVALFFPNIVYSQNIYTWQNCITEAVKNHPDLISAREKINQSKADKGTTISSLLPQINSDLSATSTKNDSSGPSEDYSYGLSGSQLLFDGFKTHYKIKGANQNITASEYSYMVTSSNVRLRLRNAFVVFLKTQNLLKITEEIAQRRRDSRELVKLRYDAGREHKGALLTAEANLVQAQAEVAQARRSIDLAQRRLNKELGRITFASLEIEGNFEIVDSQKQQPDFAEFAETTPFLRELMARKEAAKYGVGSARADFFPQVFATGGIGRSDTQWPAKDESWSAGVKVSFPLFDGANRWSSAKKAEAAFNQAKADERSGRDGVILTLHETWAALQDAIENVNVQSKFLESAEARAKISQAQYSNGLISFDDWIIIEDALVRTRKNYLEAQANALFAEASWVQAKGGTLDNES